ncbi:MAG: tetratricopeptide repeat protein, partial [Nitrosopumilus sp.]|nr:tetratricopeptide repeat protein [Nitrosopumilus sp.]
LEKRNYGEPLNRITVYLDYDTWYVIESGIPFPELYKIAESIPFEKGDGSSSITSTFENPFKGKSLVIELIDVKEIYQPTQPISFEIFTQGHIPVASQLDVSIRDYDGKIVWQNTQSVDIGDPEIGYVDYTWSTEYDLGVPQIQNTGDYFMTVSWNDVTVQHEFQIREETQFSLLRDLIPEYAHKEDFLSMFDNDCSRKEMNQEFIIENTDADIQEIRYELEKSNDLLNLIFEKQEVMTNDEERTREYIVPSQTIDCIENTQSDNMHLIEKLEQYGEKPEFDVRLLLRESEIFYHGHEYQQAIKTTDFILENIDNENTDALVVKGNSLARLGQFEKAIETYGNAIEINPDFAEGWFRMGHVLSSNDQHDLAIKHFDQAIKIDPSYADAYIGKAFTLMTLERYDDAVKSAEKAVQMYPDRPVYRQIYKTVLDVSESQSR